LAAEEVTTFRFPLIVVPEMEVDDVVAPSGAEETVGAEFAEEIREGFCATKEVEVVLLAVDVELEDVVDVVLVLDAFVSSAVISSRSSRASVNSRILKSSPMSRKSPSPIPRSPRLSTLLSNPSRSSEETLGPSPAAATVDVVEEVTTAPVEPCTILCCPG
jgi:hypothetical protein